MSIFVHLVLACLLVMTSSLAGAAIPYLRVAVAADLAPCIDALNQAFVKSTGDVRIDTSIGASGNFYAQIQHGAPFDVFLSADLDYPRALAKAGAADLASLIVYAHGRLILWSSDPRLNLSEGLEVLRTPHVQRIAIANPDSAPYGRAARAALEHAGVWPAIQHKLVKGDNVAQTAQFVRTGNAQVGLVGMAHVATEAGQAAGSAWVVPASWYPLIEQGAIITAKGRANPLSAKYLAFLQSDAAKAIFRHYHFALPQAVK